MTDYPTLEFKEVFHKYQKLSFFDMKTVLRCRNIDFDHVNWPIDLFHTLHYNINLLTHLINNIMDISVYGLECHSHKTFASGIIRYNRPSVAKSMVNARYLNNKDFIDALAVFYKQPMLLVKYLTQISLDKFKGYCNTERYYHMIHTMLLVMKVQKKVPTTVVKHLIIPFVYQ